MKAIAKERKIEVGGKELTIKKLPLRRVLKLVESIGKLPDEIAKADKISNDEMVARLPQLIATLVPQLGTSICEAVETEITVDFLLDECALDEVAELIAVIFEVNNVAGFFGQVKKIQATLKPQAQQTTTGSKN